MLCCYEENKHVPVKYIKIRYVHNVNLDYIQIVWRILPCKVACLARVNYEAEFLDVTVVLIYLISAAT